jgi:hypothetical protein
MDLTDGLAQGLSPDDLVKTNGDAPSNTIGEQFWCVIGARESYAKAFAAGSWQGFACSLADATSLSNVRDALASSRRVVVDSMEGSTTSSDAHHELLFALLEHETQHHGQLIRFFYANAIPFPAAFAHRYALE